MFPLVKHETTVLAEVQKQMKKIILNCSIKFPVFATTTKKGERATRDGLYADKEMLT